MTDSDVIASHRARFYALRDVFFFVFHSVASDVKRVSPVPEIDPLSGMVDEGGHYQRQITYFRPIAATINTQSP